MEVDTGVVSVQTKEKFKCDFCDFESPYDYYGNKPFQSKIVFLEDCFVMKDPFTKDEKPLCLGSLCWFVDSRFSFSQEAASAKGRCVFHKNAESFTPNVSASIA